MECFIRQFALGSFHGCVIRNRALRSAYPHGFVYLFHAVLVERIEKNYPHDMVLRVTGTRRHRLSALS